MPIEELSFVISYLMRQPFFTSMLQTTLQEISGQKAKEDKVALYGAVLDALIFDGDYKGEKPFAYFLKNAPLTSACVFGTKTTIFTYCGFIPKF